MSRIEQSITNDTPDHQPGPGSSIGAFGEPKGDSFNRLKGFYQRVVDSPVRVEELTRQFTNGLVRLSDGGEYTRLQLRAIFERDIFMQTTSVLEPWVEVVVPLDAGDLGRSPLLVYLGAITPSRSQNDDDVMNLSVNIDIARGMEFRSTAEVFARAQQGGYQPTILSAEERRSESVQDQISRLYTRFGWTRPDVVGMLKNPHNILSVVSHKGQIVSSGIAELALAPIEGHPFRIAELTEAATLSEFEGNGCFAAISRSLLLELAQRSRAMEIFDGELDLAFGESNGLSEGILRIAAGQGRSFSTANAEQFGFFGRGILRQQVPISGPFRRTEYNDLVVTSFTRSELYRRF